MSEYLLTVNDLSKRFGDRCVLDKVSFGLKKGQTLGLLGPNGAGKSTTVNLICGLLKADEGEVLVAGEDISVGGSKARMKLGVVPQEIALFDELSANENLRLFGGLYGLSGAYLQQRIAAVLALVSLADRAKDKPASFSGGMKRRLNIAAAMLHEPELLILDEPTVGVDPQSRNAIFDALETLKADGLALVYTSHYMEEVERLADHLVIIDHGKVIANDTPASLYQKLPAQAALFVEFSTPVDATSLNSLNSQSGVTSFEILGQGRTLSIQLQKQEQAFDCLKQLVQSGLEPTHFTTAKTKLEDVFLNLTGRSLRD